MPMISYAQRIADHAARDPEHLAVTDEHRSVTRGELDRLANRTARELTRLGRSDTLIRFVATGYSDEEEDEKEE